MTFLYGGEMVRLHLEIANLKDLRGLEEGEGGNGVRGTASGEVMMDEKEEIFGIIGLGAESIVPTMEVVDEVGEEMFEKLGE
jgi:hypothetical protein